MGRSCIDNIFPLMNRFRAALERVNPLLLFFLTLRKPMTQYGGMGCGTKRGKWVSKVSCGGWLGLYMQII